MRLTSQSSWPLWTGWGKLDWNCNMNYLRRTWGKTFWLQGKLDIVAGLRGIVLIQGGQLVMISPLSPQLLYVWCVSPGNHSISSGHDGISEYSFSLLKDFIYLFSESGEGRKRERGRNIFVWEKHQLVASHVLQHRHVPWLGTEPVTFDLWDDTQPNVPHQPWHQSIS